MFRSVGASRNSTNQQRPRRAPPELAAMASYIPWRLLGQQPTDSRSLQRLSATRQLACWHCSWQQSSSPTTLSGLSFSYAAPLALILWPTIPEQSSILFLQPFFPSSHPIHDSFPAREWAVRLPAFLLVVGLSAIGLFVGNTILKESRKKRAKLAARQE